MASLSLFLQISLLFSANFVFINTDDASNAKAADRAFKQCLSTLSTTCTYEQGKLPVEATYCGDLVVDPANTICPVQGSSGRKKRADIGQCSLFVHIIWKILSKNWSNSKIKFTRQVVWQHFLFNCFPKKWKTTWLILLNECMIVHGFLRPVPLLFDSSLDSFKTHTDSRIGI